MVFPVASIFVPEVCAYNVDETCHARAITVGDGLHAACDTFFVSDLHTRGTSNNAGVGACKVTDCRYNPTSSAQRKQFTSAYTTITPTA